jgi:phosphoribosylamine--glycine ligase
VLNTDFLDVLTAARDDDPLPQLSFRPMASVCKYAVPDGYPTDPDAGAKVTIDDEVIAEVVADHREQADDAETAPEALLFYASVDDREDGIYTTTSRSYAVVGLAEDIAAAEAIAEEALERAGTEGLRVRHDIGKADLLQQRIDHMDDIRGGAD